MCMLNTHLLLVNDDVPIDQGIIEEEELEAEHHKTVFIV